MKNIKITDSSYTEWVKCPYCHQAIKAPNKPDITFLCPNCGKELITYDKVTENVLRNIEKRKRRKNLIWYGVASIIITSIIVALFIGNRHDVAEEKGIRGETHVQTQLAKSGWKKINEWRSTKYGEKDRYNYVLYKDNGSERMKIELPMYDYVLSFDCQKYVVKNNKEFLCHVPSDVSSKITGDFYLEAGCTVYIFQQEKEEYDNNGLYNITGLLVIIDENSALLFFDDQGKRGNFMVYDVLEKIGTDNKR